MTTSFTQSCAAVSETYKAYQEAYKRLSPHFAGIPEEQVRIVAQQVTQEMGGNSFRFKDLGNSFKQKDPPIPSLPEMKAALRGLPKPKGDRYLFSMTPFAEQVLTQIKKVMGRKQSFTVREFADRAGYPNTPMLRAPIRALIDNKKIRYAEEVIVKGKPSVKSYRLVY